MQSSSFDDKRRRITFRSEGFWSPAETRRYLVEYKAALFEAGRDGIPFTVLEDLRDFSVQSSAVAEICVGFVDAIIAAPIVRFAFIVNSALLRNQLRREIAGRLTVQMFPDEDAASAWLLEVEPIRQ